MKPPCQKLQELLHSEAWHCAALCATMEPHRLPTLRRVHGCPRQGGLSSNTCNRRKPDWHEPHDQCQPTNITGGCSGPQSVSRRHIMRGGGGPQARPDVRRQHLRQTTRRVELTSEDRSRTKPMAMECTMAMSGHALLTPSIAPPHAGSLVPLVRAAHALRLFGFRAPSLMAGGGGSS